MTTYKIPVIGGDGIGPEIVREGRKVLDAVSEVDLFEIEWIDFPHGADHYLNLRPIKLYEGVETPLKNKTPSAINFTVVRENTEDFYIGLGARVKKGKTR